MMDILNMFFGSFWRWVGSIILLCIVAEVPASIIRAIKGTSITRLIKEMKED